MGKLIVIEGLDGSGKATQSRLLCEALQAQGKQAMNITFPNYASQSSALIQMYLAGEFGSQPSDVNAYAASVFYSVDRYASYQTGWRDFYLAGGIVIADRYTTSNAVHQCSKLPREEWGAYLDWLFALEYDKIGIPTPDCVIYLDVEPEVSQRLMAQRYAGDETKKDIHEKDVAYLRTSRLAAEYCVRRLGWHKIDCCAKGEMRTIEAIAKDVLSAVK